MRSCRVTDWRVNTSVMRATMRFRKSSFRNSSARLGQSDRRLFMAVLTLSISLSDDDSIACTISPSLESGGKLLDKIWTRWKRAALTLPIAN